MSSSSAPDEVQDTRAEFTGRSASHGDRLGGSMKTDSSPLLSSTPVTVSKVLVKSYPYFVIIDKFLSVITWTNEDGWLSMLVVALYVTFVLYFEWIVTYLGHLLPVTVLLAYSLLSKHVEEKITNNPTLDDIVHLLTALSVKADIFLNPITSLALTSYDIKRILFTTVFLSPLYVSVMYFILSPKSFMLIFGVYVLTYHSAFLKVTRRLLWRVRLIRLLSFYLTGLDFGGINIDKDSGIFAAVKRVNERVGIQNSKDGKPIVFTYVLYENQRRWLGIGWTPNLLSYERTAWTDEFLNESSPTDKFKLPETEEGSNLVWKWVDKTWRLDLTNDGAIQLPSSRSKTTANPSSDEGFIFYDNTWKKPSTEDSFSKYTRRRRWIRTAELVPTNSSQSATKTNSPTTPSKASKSGKQATSPSSIGIETEVVPITEVQNVQASGTTDDNEQQGVRKRKSLRFDDQPNILSSVKELEKKNRRVSFTEPKENGDDTGNDKPNQAID
jgi:hypothetical protein